MMVGKRPHLPPPAYKTYIRPKDKTYKAFE